MKDKEDLVLGRQFPPRNRPLMIRIWKEMDEQISNYIRGKFIEVLIVGGAAYLLFIVLGMNYAAVVRSHWFVRNRALHRRDCGYGSGCSSRLCSVGNRQ